MSKIPSILAIEPNPDRASALAHLVHDYVEADVVVSASADVALAVMVRRMPELILLSAFTPPGEERSLMTFLRHSTYPSVPVLIMSPGHDQLLKKSVASSGMRWLSRRGPAMPVDPMRDALGARMRSALEKSREQQSDACLVSPETAHAVREGLVRVPRPRRWATPDGSPLSSVRLASGFVGRLMNISNSGLLLESDSPLMPGMSGTFEFANPNRELTRIWRPEMALIVPAHVIRSEVSKIAPDCFRYRVAARFVRDLELLADSIADLGAPPLRIETPSTPVESDCAFRATSARLEELARALENLQCAIGRLGPPTSASTRTH